MARRADHSDNPALDIQPLPLATLTPMTKTKAKSKSKSKSSKTSVTPLGDRILVRRMDAEETSKGGIILPDSAKVKPAEGTVIAVGAGKITDTGERLEMSLKAKDRILFSSYSGSEIKLDGEDYLIMSEDEVLAVID